MFYNNNSEKENAQQKNHSDNMQLGMVGLVIAGLAVGGSLTQIERFYITNFQTIWISVWCAFLVMLFLALRWYIEKNRDVEKEGVIYTHLAIPHDSQSIYVGSADDTAIYLSRKMRLGHVQILGTTGRGKTESVILPWILRDAKNSVSSLVIDGKGDPELSKKIALTYKNVKVFDLGNPKNSCTMNPLAFGSSGQITDRIFTSFDFDDSYYKGVQYDVAYTLVSALMTVEGSVSFTRIHACLVNDLEIAKLLKACTDIRLKSRLQKLLSTPKHLREQNYMGLITQLAPFAEGEVAELVNGPKAGRDILSLSEVVLSNTSTQVTVILLPTLKYQILGKQLGRMLLQELAGLIGERSSLGGSKARFFSVYLDEFSAFAYEGFEQILNKARSSRVAMHLSHQSMADLSLVSEDFARVINTNTNVKCLLGLNDPDTADFYARHIGTKGSERKTERVEDAGWLAGSRRTGQASVREVEEYKVHPNKLKNFTNGQGVLHLPTSDGNFTSVIQFERYQSEKKNV